MTKKLIETKLDDSNWQDELVGNTVEQAIEWLRQFPLDAQLREEYGYELSTYGEIYVTREETAAEEAARLAKEFKEEQQCLEAKRKSDEQLAERMMLIAAKDVAFKAYMEKHKDNPNIGDLSNLFMSAMQSMNRGFTGAAVQPLLDVMERLEKEGGTA